MKAISIAAAAAVLATGAAASAQTATDARCILLSSAFAKEAKDPQAQKVAEAAFYFYLGRIGAAASAAQLKSVLDAQVNTITDAGAGGQMNECVKGVQAKVQLVQSLSTPPATAAPPKKP